MTKKEKSDMRTREIYLTGQEKPFIVRNYSQKNNGKDGVGGVNWRWFPFWAGFILAMVIPFLLDWALFGTPIPCQTEKVFKDGSSIQRCEVRK